MKVNLDKLKQGRNEFRLCYKEKELSLEKVDFSLVGDVDARLVFVKSRNNVKLTIELSYKLKLTCARCLEKFEKDFKESATFYLKIGQEELTEEKHLSDEDIYTLYYPVEEIDVTPLVREIVILSAPMKPLCREDCKGLCPVCGANLNKVDCGHKREAVDPRWEKLRQLKDLLGEKGSSA